MSELIKNAKVTLPKDLFDCELKFKSSADLKWHIAGFRDDFRPLLIYQISS